MLFNFDNLRKNTPRQLQTSLPDSWVMKLLSSATPTSKFSRKLLRALYGKQYKHMSIAGAAFQLKPTTHPQIWEVYWKGKKLGETHPFPNAFTDSSPDSDIWIMATGPSINQLDLKQLKSRNVFGVNGSIAVCQKHGIQPQYYASSDHNFFNDRMSLVKEAVNSGTHCFFSFNGISKICQHAPELIAQGKISLFETVNRYYGLPRLTSSDLRAACDTDPDLSMGADHHIGWSNDLTKGVFIAKTITFSACQIAQFLGAKNIFLLGMDLGHSADQPVRAYESGAQACNSSLDKDYLTTILPSFEFLKKTMMDSSSQFRVWNISPQSRLPDEVIPKITYEQALNHQLPATP